MGRGRKTVLAGKRILQCLNVRIHNFNVFAAPLAEEMVVMRAAGMFVAGETVAEMQFARQARIAQQFHGAVHGSLPEGRIFVPDEIVQFLNRQMAFLMKKNVDNSVALRCVSQALAAQEGGKGGGRISWKGGRVDHGKRTSQPFRNERKKQPLTPPRTALQPADARREGSMP